MSKFDELEENELRSRLPLAEVVKNSDYDEKKYFKMQENRFSFDDDLINGLIQTLEIIGEFLYSILPFVIFFYCYQIYNEPFLNNDEFYYPDFTINEKNGINMNVQFFDLKDYESTGNGWNNEERILFLVPLRDASAHLPLFFSHLTNMTYPHHLVDISFLISDTSDSTVADLNKFLQDYQNRANTNDKFGKIEIFEKDFGQIVGQSFSDRHGFQAQGPRRKKMAIARNWLLSTSLKPYHSWVYWRDIDVETCPSTILEDLMHHNKDVIVPNIWRPLPDWLGGEQAYDLNSWQESEGGIELADRLDEDAVIVEGYAEYATWRPHLAYLRDPYGNPEVEIELDGIGGVSILSKARVFRHGAMFPAFSFKKHAETEGFGKLCKTMGFEVVGLPHYVIWHIYEPSTDDLKHMEWLADEELRRKENLKNRVVFEKAWKSMFRDVNEDWELEKYNVFKNNDLTSLKLGRVSWEDEDEFLVEIDEDEVLEDEFLNNQGDQFLVAFNNYKVQNFEKSVLAQLQKSDGPISYGSSKYETLFNNFDTLNEESLNRRPMKFKKFEVEPEEDEEEYEYDEIDDDEIEGKYDLVSDRVILEDDISNKIIDSSRDKQLFDILESVKNELDGEEEGGVQFKSQKLVKDTKSNRNKVKSKAKNPSKVLKKKIKRRTFYEIEDGATIATIVQTLASPKQTKIEDVNVREALDEVINLLSEKLDSR